MGTERKTMISARLPLRLIERADFVARNTTGEGTKNRSAVIQTALEDWLALQERELEKAGILTKKGR